MHNGRKNEPNPPSMRPECGSKTKLPFQEGLIFIKPFDHNFARETLGKPKESYVLVPSLIETTLC